MPGGLEGLRAAARSARAALAKRPARGEARSVTALEQALGQSGSGSDERSLLAGRLDAGRPTAVLVTGYYEPTLRGCRAPAGACRVPILGMPSGGGPLPARSAIESGALAGRGLELFWTDDPIGLYFLQVQGSGRLALPDGSVVRLGYAGNNGRAYTSIGALMVREGIFAGPEAATAPAIRTWLGDHPAAAPGLMRRNDRYVFFRVLGGPPGAGPPGSLGALLVPWRSVAVDPSVTPLGSVGWLEVLLPDGTRFAGLVVAMDTGAAIRGPGRIDLFLGPGDRAEDVAGRLRGSGQVTWFR